MAGGSSVYARSSDHVALGRAMRELRARRGVSQQILEFDAGMSRMYLTKLERGAASPSFGTLLAFVRALRVPLGELVEIYERQLAVIDPDAGKDAPRCPTHEALVYARQENERERARVAAKARGRIRPWT